MKNLLYSFNHQFLCEIKKYIERRQDLQNHISYDIFMSHEIFSIISLHIYGTKIDVF